MGVLWISPARFFSDLSHQDVPSTRAGLCLSCSFRHPWNRVNGALGEQRKAWRPRGDPSSQDRQDPRRAPPGPGSRALTPARHPLTRSGLLNTSLGTAGHRLTAQLPGGKAGETYRWILSVVRVPPWRVQSVMSVSTPLCLYHHRGSGGVDSIAQGV